MRSFADCNPICVFVYFTAVTVLSMFCMDALILAFSLCGAILLLAVRKSCVKAGFHVSLIVMFAVMSLINPLLSHNGATVMFVMNDNPVTLEALIFGVVSSGMIVSSLYWLRSFFLIMTSERLLYVFGKASPSSALAASMALRYAPRFALQIKKTNAAQKAIGLYGNDNIVDDVKSGLRVFSVMLTWSLENGALTADSMAARGYGSGRRTSYSRFIFRKSDAVLLIVTLAAMSVTAAGIALGYLGYDFYPTVAPSRLSVMSGISYSAYAFLALLPSAIEIKENIKWKYLRSKI